MRYKDQNDIDFQTWWNFSESIKEMSDDEIKQHTKEVFKTENLEQFSKALNAPTPFYYKLDFDFKTAGTFIDVDTLFSDRQFLDFAKLVVKKRFVWQTIHYTKAVVEHAIQSYYNYIVPFKENYPWIYNPPTFSNSSEMTQGSEQRKEFAQHYGGYMEIFYLLSNSDFSKFDEIMNWEVQRFLFQGEYLLRKKTVEQLK